MKAIALQACLELAHWIYDSEGTSVQSLWWEMADKIERRFRIIGATQATVDRWSKQRKEYVKERNRALNALHPDRLSYLHR